MSAAIPAVIVTSIGRQTAWMRFSLARPNQHNKRQGEGQKPSKKRGPELDPQGEGGLFLGGIPFSHLQTCPRQNPSHIAAVFIATMAQDRSPPLGDTHHAAVRLPPPEPSETQRIVGPLTVTWPCEPVPVGSPRRRTKASRAWIALASGHGCPRLQLPSSSRAAIPARRTRGPSAHQIGPSPSQTAVGVQWKASPAGTTDR